MIRVRDLCRAFAGSWFAVVAVGLLTCIVLYQRWDGSHRHRKLQQVLSVGDHLTAVHMETTDNTPVDIDWKSDRRATVLYVLTPTCPWCQLNLPDVRALVDGTSANYRFIGVSLTRDGLSEYLDRAKYGFPVYVAGPDAAQLKLHATPETIIVSPTGKVVKVWIGAYLNTTALDVENTFGVKLPRLSPD